MSYRTVFKREFFRTYPMMLAGHATGFTAGMLVSTNRSVWFWISHAMLFVSFLGLALASAHYTACRASREGSR